MGTGTSNANRLFMKDLPPISCFRLLAASAFLVSASMAFGTSISITFNDITGDLGVTSQSYSSGGTTVTAFGYVSGSPSNLFGKNDGGDEIGIGLTGQPNNEITPTDFIQLDISQLATNGFTTASLFVGSTQATDEPWDLYASNTLGTLGVIKITSNTTDYPNGVDISSLLGYKYIGLTANPGGIGGQNVLLGAITANAPSRVPDSGSSIGILSMGLMALFLLRRKMRPIADYRI
jgi:VPDSG-CTERM motif